MHMVTKHLGVDASLSWACSHCLYNDSHLFAYVSVLLILSRDMEVDIFPIISGSLTFAGHSDLH